MTRGDQHDWTSAAKFLLSVRPFERSAPIFYEGFYSAAQKLIAAPQARWSSEQLLIEINDQFQDAFSKLPNRPDPHLNVGIYDNLRVRTKRGEPRRTRVVLLLSRLMREALIAEEKNNRRATASHEANESRSANRPRAFLPSPLYFLRQYLTSPDYPASSAYAHAAVRAIIFAAAVRFKNPNVVETMTDVQLWERVREIIQFERVVEALDNIEAHRQKLDTLRPTSETDFLVMHHLAAKGVLNLSFAHGEKQYQSANETPLMTRDGEFGFLKRGTILPLENTAYEFRPVDLLLALPTAAEIMNEIDGVPVPIPGGDIVFAGGLRLTETTGTVWRVSGRSGTGKTSFALGLAIALAPLGIATLYLSCEEAKEDLKNRLETLVPFFVRRTDSYIRFRDWFFPQTIDGDPDELNVRVQGYLRDYIEQFGKDGRISAAARPQGLVPCLIVLDGVHEVLLREGKSESANLRKLVEACRKVGVLVLLLTASSEELSELDYLVDGVATLEIKEVEDKTAPPLRQFVIRKSRRQYSRSGAHVLHISPRSGIRITPQLVCQRDRLRDLAWVPVDASKFLDVFRYAAGGSRLSRPEYVDVIKIPQLSQILISGRGSSGKAGLALRILLSGETDQTIEKRLREDADRSLFRDNLETLIGEPPERRRILVVSFLYETPYYMELAADVSRAVLTNSRPGSWMPVAEIRGQHFYPGFLSPEDFIRKIDEKLGWAELHGAPFDGVLIDGLHNVFLQFPRLQDAPLVWPVLFEMLRKRGVTVVTTHTHFDLDSDINESRFARFAADVSAIAGRVEPLLHALVSAADFYIELRAPQGRSENQSSEFNIVFRTATGQTPSGEPCIWQRQSLQIVAAQG